MKKRLSSRGFTLVELSVVIIVISIVVGMGLVATMGALETARRTQTENKLNEIEKALMAFRKQYNRLPCPGDSSATIADSDYGKEDATSGVCNYNSTTPPYGITNTDLFRTIEGGVPTRSLNLPDEYMFDGWGRRFVYAVDELAATLKDAFSIIPPQSNDCSITIYDASNYARSSGAIYALMSYGPNGHGGFINGSTRLSTGVTNTQEQTNCHCDSTGAYSAPTSMRLVQREQVESVSAVASFDDIVRYKERWELQTNDDYVYSATHREFQLAVQYSNATTRIYLYRHTCHGWKASPTASQVPASTIRALGFTYDNDNLFAYTADATIPVYYCYNYTISGNSMGTVSPISNCVVPTATSGALFSNNGYVAITNNTSPYVQLFRVSESTYNLFPTTSKNFYTGDAPTAQPTVGALSPNADFLFVSDKSTYANLYARIDDRTYRKIHSSYQPVAAATCNASLANIGNAEFSSDGRYFVLSCANTTPAVKVWTITGGLPLFDNTTGDSPFDAISPAALSTVLFGSVAPKIAVSKDSRYLAAAASTGSGAISDIVKIFKIDAGDTFTDISPSGNLSLATAVLTAPPILFTREGYYLLVPVSFTGGNGMLIFRKNAGTTFSLVSYNATPFYSATASIQRMAIIH